MIVTTSSNIESREISEYLGLVFGEVIEGAHFGKDFTAGIRNIVGGRVKGYEKALVNSRDVAILEMKNKAAEMGADAVIACKMDYETLGAGSDMMMVTVCGTAVKLK